MEELEREINTFAMQRNQESLKDTVMATQLTNNGFMSDGYDTPIDIEGPPLTHYTNAFWKHLSENNVSTSEILAYTKALADLKDGLPARTLQQIMYVMGSFIYSGSNIESTVDIVSARLCSRLQ